MGSTGSATTGGKEKEEKGHRGDSDWEDVLKVLGAPMYVVRTHVLLVFFLLPLKACL